jgi:hypothetical protein
MIATAKEWVRQKAGWLALSAVALGSFGLGCAVTVLEVRADCTATLAASSEGYRAALTAKDQLIQQLGLTATKAVGQAASAVGQAADAAASAADSAATAATAAADKAKADAERAKTLRNLK